MYRRISALASLAVLAMLAFGGASAQAALGDELTCQFDGLSGTLIADDDTLGPGLPNWQADLATGSPDDREYGGYTFSGEGRCTGVVNGTPIPPSSTPNATIESVGRYENILCGTGWARDRSATGTWVDIHSTSANPDVPAGEVGYVVQFTGGNGVLQIGPPESAGDYVGEGFVNIVPRDLVTNPIGHPYGNCATHNVTEFEVTGAFTAADTT